MIYLYCGICKFEGNLVCFFRLFGIFQQNMPTSCFMAVFVKRTFELLLYIVAKIKMWKISTEAVLHIHSKDSSLTYHLIRRRGLLKRPFRPPLILSNAYIQTLAGLLCKPLEHYHFEREYLQVADKCVVALDWFRQSTEKIQRTSPILLIFPQLSGDAVAVGNLCKVGASKGMRTVVFNRRGHGSSFLLSADLTCIGDTSDTRKVVKYICNRFPLAKIVGIGLGEGCATLISYLGEYGSSSQMTAAVNISPAFTSAETFYQQIPKFYAIYLLLILKFMILRNWKVFCDVFDIKTLVLKTWNLKEFEYSVYNRIYGIESYEAFSQQFDPLRDVDDIAVPVLCINSVDDPISIKDNIPFELFQFYPNLLLLTVEKGGHCAFYENVNGDSWANKVAIKYVENVLEFVSNVKYWHKL